MHDFDVVTFTSPTYCAYCQGFIWGVAKQGVRCSKCELVAHKKCALKALDHKCPSSTRKSSSPATASTPPQSPGSIDPTDSVSQSQATVQPDTPGYVQQLDKMFWQQVDEESKVNTLLSAQTEQPLSLFQTLPANFMQFTAKLAPLSLVHRGAADILMWKRPRNSLVAMFVYTMYCLRPNLLIVTPLGLVIAYILFNYYNSGYADLSEDTEAVDAQGAGSQTNGAKTLGAGFFNIVPLAASASPAMSSASLAGSTASFASAWQRSTTSTGNTARLRDRKRSQTASGPYPSIATGREPSASAPNSPETQPPALSGSNSSTSAPSSPKPRLLVRSRANGTPGARQRRPIDLAAIFGVASFGSAKYTDNVHTTQTLTGTYVSAYDFVAAHNSLVDWSRPKEARRILQACLWMQLAIVVVVYWVPWYLLFLVGGNGGLLSMSPHVRAFLKVYGVELVLYLHERIELRLLLIKHWMERSWLARVLRLGNGSNRIFFVSPGLLPQDSDDSDFEVASGSGYRTPPLLHSLGATPSSSTATLVRRPHTVSVFENQRWWLGFGWIPRLGSSERAKWSDESGRLRYASLSDFLPEDGYVWADESAGWEIDRLWALPVATDSEGWVYTDNFWKRPSPTASAVSSYTRRRKWIRRVRPAGSLGSRLEMTRVTPTAPDSTSPPPT
ncbi:hypothetical protein GGI07_004704 [Coemansia sp. Benny D115]|nr:hypothetical protein GGI07_004704 [Coemansia sp. Benny D115]